MMKSVDFIIRLLELESGPCTSQPCDLGQVANSDSEMVPALFGCCEDYMSYCVLNFYNRA